MPSLRSRSVSQTDATRSWRPVGKGTMGYAYAKVKPVLNPTLVFSCG
ncbi:hypothetical protein [Nostoc sp.]